MLAQHFHDTTIQVEELIVVLLPRVPLAVSHLKNSIQAVGKRLVGAKDPEIALVPVERDHIAQKDPKLVRVGGTHGPR